MQSNRIELTGYLAAKPEGRRLPSGTPVANARLGQTDEYSTREGTRKNTNWFSLTFYGGISTVALTYDKGENVHIIGSIRQRQFTPKDGSTRTVYEVVVERCHRLAPQERERVTPPEIVAGESAESLSEGARNPAPEAHDAWDLL